MPQLSPKFQWVLTLTNEELVLINQALRGKITSINAAACNQLANNLARQRSSAVEHTLRENQKLIDNLEAVDPLDVGFTRDRLAREEQ
jgi:hypothetical protein